MKPEVTAQFFPGVIWLSYEKLYVSGIGLGIEKGLWLAYVYVCGQG